MEPEGVPARPGLGTVLVTGAAGFVGRHVVDALAAFGASETRLLCHRRRPLAAPSPGVTLVHGDLTDERSLRGVCEGVDVLLHLASHVGGSPEQAVAVNVDGTRSLVAQAERSGVRRLVHLSTAAVYRDGAHRGASEDELEVRPASVTSRTRLAAERIVLRSGGTVLRPHLVHGSGDTWLVPAVVAMTNRLPRWVDGGQALLSVVAVEDLAAAVLGVAASPGPRGAVLHASHPRPVTARELVATVRHAMDLPALAGDVTLAEALSLTGASDDPTWRRRVSLLWVDHWYDSSRLWALIGAAPGGSFADRFAEHAAWYRRQAQVTG